jgi:hypothetical protein
MTHVSANHFTIAIDAAAGDSIDYFFVNRPTERMAHGTSVGVDVCQICQQGEPAHARRPRNSDPHPAFSCPVKNCTGIAIKRDISRTLSPEVSAFSRA